MVKSKKRESMFAEIQSEQGALRAMRSTLVILAWLAISYMVILNGLELETSILAGFWAVLALLAYACFKGVRWAVLVVIIFSTLEVGWKAYFMLLNGSINGLATVLIFGYLVIRAFKGWSYKIDKANKERLEKILAEEDENINDAEPR